MNEAMFTASPQMSKVNRGRAFYVEPDQLGEFVLIDYVTHKKRRVG